MSEVERKAEEVEAERIRLAGDLLDERRELARQIADELRFYKVRQWVLYVILFACGVGAAFYSAAQDREIRATTDGLCQLNASRLSDKERQIAQTREYLRTDEGRMHNGLNDFIRENSLPRLKREVKLDRKNFPAGCRELLDKKR